jgi:hypothetical protein
LTHTKVETNRRHPIASNAAWNGNTKLLSLSPFTIQQIIVLSSENGFLLFVGFFPYVLPRVLFLHAI